MRKKKELNLLDKLDRLKAGYLDAAEVCMMNDYSSISVLNRLIDEGKVPPPDVVVSRRNVRLWLHEKARNLPQPEKTRKVREDRECDKTPAIQMSKEQAKLLQDTQAFFRLMVKV